MLFPFENLTVLEIQKTGENRAGGGDGRREYGQDPRLGKTFWREALFRLSCLRFSKSRLVKRLGALACGGASFAEAPENVCVPGAGGTRAGPGAPGGPWTPTPAASGFPPRAGRALFARCYLHPCIL